MMRFIYFSISDEEMNNVFVPAFKLIINWIIETYIIYLNNYANSGTFGKNSGYEVVGNPSSDDVHEYTILIGRPTVGIDRSENGLKAFRGMFFYGIYLRNIKHFPC